MSTFPACRALGQFVVAISMTVKHQTRVLGHGIVYCSSQKCCWLLDICLMVTK
jgi:hypothetical protein